MNSNFLGPVNIGSEEMISINDFAQMAINISGKNLKISNIQGEDFIAKYGFPTPIGVMGRRSDNDLYFSKMNWRPKQSLKEGMSKTFSWIKQQAK